MGSLNQQSIMRSLNGLFFSSLDLFQPGWVDLVSWLSPTDQPQETYRWLGQVPGMRQWTGGRQPKQLLDQGVVVSTSKYESTIEFDEDDLRFEKLGQLRMRIQEHAQIAGVYHWFEMLSSKIVTPGNAYDGVAYWSDSHVDGAGTQSNILSVDVAAPGTPTASDMETAITSAVQQLHGIKDDSGRALNAQARDFFIMVPTHFWAAAAKALGLDIIVDSGTSRSNLLPRLPGYNFSLEPNPELSTSANVFYVFRTDAQGKAFLRQQQGAVEQDSKDDTFDNGRWLFGVKVRRAVAPALWQYGIQVTLT